ncbi:hypothetical protein SAMN04487949_2670 [Halogranum gelatinilyticum]|uniref:PGF-CTERM archaeal protein-sorting signal domain-containing protein n=1 Tax=Halogranum gelatinilyticum TaxID=660521 RepID=A0A1G9W9F0_9EURY|nr:BGTF surface domain-containing protein [Halogranum gelatinilyticum]SDM81194.1 hypothetical protein SAMN04487949_2670 [Halogranum gelatinilyticum]
MRTHSPHRFVAALLALSLVAVGGAAALTATPAGSADAADLQSVQSQRSQMQVNASFDVQGDAVRLPAVENATVTGQTNLSAGTEVTLRLQSAGDAENPFLKSTTATVTEDGSFRATVNLSNVEPSTDAELTLQTADAGTVAEADAQVVAADATTDSETATTSPGFGLVAGGCALLGAALLARRD